MGNGAMIRQEAAKPLDCSDLHSEAEARKEVAHLRQLLRANEPALLATAAATTATTASSSPPLQLAVGGSAAAAAAPGRKAAARGGVTGVKSPSRVNLEQFNKYAGCIEDPAGFDVKKDAPTLHDYLLNEFHRFAGDEQVLGMVAFWRFLGDLELGLSEAEVLRLRAVADANRDGVVDWEELLNMLKPTLALLWAAKLQGGAEWDQWERLHWHTHHAVVRDSEGYTKKGAAFYVNKLTGESTWAKPDVLTRHTSIEARRMERLLAPPPTLTHFLEAAFDRHARSHARSRGGGGTEKSLTYPQFWKLVRTELPELGEGLGENQGGLGLTKAELQAMSTAADSNKDARIDRSEFVSYLVPKVEACFRSRGGGGSGQGGSGQGGGGKAVGPSQDKLNWVALTTVWKGEEYLYWYNRVTHESTWENPIAAANAAASAGAAAAPTTTTRRQGAVKSSG